MIPNTSEAKSTQEANQQVLRRNRIQTVYSNNQPQIMNNNFQMMGNALSNHLKALRRNNLINLLSQKQAQQRNDKQNKLIMEMLKNQQFFQPIANNYKYFSQISSKIGYSFFKKDQFIYKIHEFTEGYFILIKGQVQLTIPQRIDIPDSNGLTNFDSFLTNAQIKSVQFSKPGKEASHNKHSIEMSQKPLKLSKRQSRISIKLSRSPSIISTDKFDLNSQKIDQLSNKKSEKQSKENYIFTSQFEGGIQQIDQLMHSQDKQGQVICENKVVKVVQEGQCFGQITIGQVNKRATNAIAKEDCHLIVIRKQQYQLVSKASLITQMKALHNFLVKIPLLKKVYRYSLQGFLYYMQQVKCTYKSILYKQGSSIEYVYIIKQGEFTQFKSIKQKQANKSSLSSHQTKHTTHSKDQLNEFKQNNFIWRQGFFKNICQGEIIGDCQIYMKKQKYMESCKCISQMGVVYRMQKKSFFQKLLSSENEVSQIKKYLNQKFRNKTSFIQNFIRQQQNQLIERYLPPSRSFHSSLRKRSQIYSKTSPNQRKQTFSQDRKGNQNKSNNFFDNFNKTIFKVVNKNRLSVHKHKHRSFSQLTNNLNSSVTDLTQSTQNKSQLQRINIPSNIREIVQIINQKQKYSNVRRQKAKQTIKIFQFDMQKIPRFIQQKYSHLLQKAKPK